MSDKFTKARLIKGDRQIKDDPWVFALYLLSYETRFGISVGFAPTTSTCRRVTKHQRPGDPL